MQQKAYLICRQPNSTRLATQHRHPPINPHLQPTGAGTLSIY
ncbi:MAG TPA: hypothetical protein VGN00_14795 [Puia sp.]